MLGQHLLDELLSERDKINAILQQIIDEATSPWGVKVSIVEVKDVEIPTGMQRAMARQAEAERERRAKVISAEGEFQASERLKDAADVMAAAPMALQLRYLQTLLEIGATNSTTIVFPAPIDLITAVPREAGRRARRLARSVRTVLGVVLVALILTPLAAWAVRGLRRVTGAVAEGPALDLPDVRRRADRPRRDHSRRHRRHRVRVVRTSPAALPRRAPAAVGPAPLPGSLDHVELAASAAATGARLETCSPSRRRITITPWVARPERLIPSTGMRITVPPSEISITC